MDLERGYMVNYTRLCALFLVTLMVLPAAMAPIGASGGSASPAARNAENGPWHFPEGGVQDRAAGRATTSVIYAILCPSVFKDALLPLKEWKTKKGMNAEIYTKEDMLAAYSGPSTVPDFAKVHQYLRRLYVNNSELKWVLIVGDGDVGGETFPVPYIYTNATWDPVMGDSSIGCYVPSDVVYSGLQKDWNSNGNDWWGEPGEEDWTPEVYVGRWPVKNAVEVQSQVNKVLTYEKTPPAGTWINTALFAGALYDVPNIVAASPLTWNYGEFEYPHDNGRTPILDSANQMPGMTKNIMLDYDQLNGGSYNGWSDTLSPSGFVAAMNAGASLVTTASHGWISGNGINQYYGNGSDPNNATVDSYSSFLFWSDSQTLTNGYRLPLMYTSACDAANFTTVWAPYIGSNVDRTQEQLLKNMNGGAIGFIGATNGDFWHNEYGNWWLEVNFWKTFFNNSFRPGESLYKSKVAYDAFLKSDGKNLDLPRIRQNKACYILLGDPEVPIWTNTPGTLTVDYPASLYTIPQKVNVTVKDAATSAVVKNAMVAFTAGGTFARGFTDASGKVQLTVDPADPGTVNITATAHNYLPYEGTANVAPTPADLTINASDITITGPSGTIKDGDQMTVSVNVHNIGRLTADSVTVKLYLGDPPAGTELGSTTATTVAARGNTVVQIPWTATSGDNKLVVVVDPNNVISEYDEANNIASANLKVAGVDFVLTVASINITKATTINDVPNIANGSMATIIVSVSNIGVNDAQNVYVRLYDGDPSINGTRIDTDKRVELVPAGGFGNATFYWNGTSMGTHALFAVADPLGQFIEYDKSNNGANVTLYANAPPSWVNPPPPQALDEDRAQNNALDLQLYMSDPDNNVMDLQYRLVSSTLAEANISISPDGGVSIRPLPDWNGMTVVTAGASDGVTEVYTKFNVTIRPVPDAPIIDTIPEANITEGQYFVVNVTARDIDFADTLTFTDDSPIFIINASYGRIAFTPKRADVGKHSVKITVTDSSGLTAFTTWKFTVIRLNGPPVFLATGEIVVMGVENKPLVFKFNATDPDNDPLTFSDDSPYVDINPTKGEINFTPLKGTAGTYMFNITVRDNGNLSDTRVVRLIIAAAPVITKPIENTLPGWLFPLLGILVIVAVVAAVGVAMSRKRRQGAEETAKNAQYDNLYGPSALTRPEMATEEAGEQQPEDAPSRKCPHCGSIRIQVFEDGGAICNKCGKTVDLK